MGVFISPIVRTTYDVAGNPYTEVFSIYEYRDAGLQPLGEAADLSAYMRRVEYIMSQPISGALLHQPFPTAGDFPGNAGSGRMGLRYATSTQIDLVMTSGQIFTVSGVIGPFSGTGYFDAGALFTVVLSGVAVSGTRAYIHAFGY